MIPPIEFELMDNEGRPLFERRAPTELREGVEFRLERCPYRGSRFHHPLLMNASGLQQVSRHWGAVIAIVSALREDFIRRNARPVLTGTDLLQIAFLVNGVFGYRVLSRASVPHDARVPAPLSATYKVSVGLVTLLLRLCVRDWIEGEDLQKVVTVDMLDEFAERGHLIGSVGVCPATPKMIREILDVFVNGREVLTAGAEVREIVQQYDQLADYAQKNLAVRLVQDAMDVERRALVECVLRLTGTDECLLFTRLAHWYREDRTFQTVHSPYLLQAIVDETRRASYLRGVSRLIRRLGSTAVGELDDAMFAGASYRVPPGHLAAAAVFMRGLPTEGLGAARTRQLQTILARQMQLLQLASDAYVALSVTGARPEKHSENAERAGEAQCEVADFRTYATLLDFVVRELRRSKQHR